MQISEELFQNILDQPNPVDLSRLTPYCSDFTLDSFSQYRKHFKNTRTANEYAYMFADFFNLLKKDIQQISAEDVHYYFSSVRRTSEIIANKVTFCSSISVDNT